MSDTGIYAYSLLCYYAKQCKNNGFGYCSWFTWNIGDTRVEQFAAVVVGYCNEIGIEPHKYLAMQAEQAAYEKRPPVPPQGIMGPWAKDRLMRAQRRHKDNQTPSLLLYEDADIDIEIRALRSFHATMLRLYKDVFGQKAKANSWKCLFSSGFEKYISGLRHVIPESFKALSTTYCGWSSEYPDKPTNKKLLQAFDALFPGDRRR